MKKPTVTKQADGKDGRFFLPFAKDKTEAESVWHSIRKFAEQTTGWLVDDEQRIFSLAFSHNGEDYYAAVGEPEPLTGETVVAILSSNAYLICTPTRGVIKGMPILVGYSRTFGIVPFSDYKGSPSINYFEANPKKRKRRTS